MNDTNKNLPSSTYGVAQNVSNINDYDRKCEDIKNLGYTVISSGYTESTIENYQILFNKTRESYINKYGESFLKEINEYHTIRAPLFYEKSFIDIAVNEHLTKLLKALFDGIFILNQSNGVINPPIEDYNQGAWHRDLPYQHFVSSKPLSANALYCVDDFTIENGATAVIPASHKSEAFPSKDFINNHAIQIEARAGDIIVMDSMVFHGGCKNNSDKERRGINHVYSIPFFKQQINIPNNISEAGLNEQQKEILGFKFKEPQSVDHFFKSRK